MVVKHCKNNVNRKIVHSTFYSNTAQSMQFLRTESNGVPEDGVTHTEIRRR